MKHENCLYLNHFVVDDANFLSFDWSIEESNKEIAMDGGENRENRVSD